jgi:hypothetical protein
MSKIAAATKPSAQIAAGTPFAQFDLSQVSDPQPDWVAANPDRALAFFYVSPRPCAALERLMQLN